MALCAEGGLEFSEAKDFANSIQLVKTEEPVAAEEPDTMDTKMEEVEEEKPPAPAPLPPPPPRAATEPRHCTPLSLFLCGLVHKHILLTAMAWFGHRSLA